MRENIIKIGTSAAVGLGLFFLYLVFLGQFAYSGRHVRFDRDRDDHFGDPDSKGTDSFGTEYHGSRFNR